jgi:hypothetical protein
MARTLSTIVTLTPEQKLAQLILIPYLLGSARVLTNQPWGTKEFGSSDKAYWIQQIRDSHPELELKINGKKLTGLIDTGADVLLLSLFDWPDACLAVGNVGPKSDHVERNDLAKRFFIASGRGREPREPRVGGAGA